MATLLAVVIERTCQQAYQLHPLLRFLLALESFLAITIQYNYFVTTAAVLRSDSTELHVARGSANITIGCHFVHVHTAMVLARY